MSPNYSWWDWVAVMLHVWRRLLEFEYLDEVVSAGIDDEVFMAVDRDSLGRVDVGRDTVVEGTVDGPSGVDVAGSVQQHAAVSLVTDDEVGWTVEAQAARLVQLVVACTSSLPANSVYIHCV